MRRVAVGELTAICLAVATQAQANTVVVQNTTDNVSYLTGSGGGPTDFFSNGTSAVGAAPIGSNFATSQLSFTSTQLTGGNYAIDLQYTTLFAGVLALGGQSVYYPDIFLRPSAAGYSTAPFTYAISLGDERTNGGMAAGLYSVSSYLTSQQVWSGRPGFIYSGQYTNTAAYQPGQAGFAGYNAPVVATGGTKLAAANVTSGQGAGGFYTVDVQLTLTAAEAALFATGADLFWGTGDCANGSFLASVAAVSGVSKPPSLVPEPATFALMAAGLISLAVMRRRRV